MAPLFSPLMTEEFFGPIVGAYVYPDQQFDTMLRTIDESSAYGLTGSIFATERTVIANAAGALRHAAGNFYINDKPTGAVVGGITVGLTEVMTAGYLDQRVEDSLGANFHLLMPYLLLIVVLMVRPTGFFGSRHVERTASLPL